MGYKRGDKVRAKDLILDALEPVPKHTRGIVLAVGDISYSINDKPANYELTVAFDNVKIPYPVTTDEIEYASRIRRYLTL